MWSKDWGVQYKTSYNLYEDHQKNLWIGGIGGLQKYTQPQLNFRAWICEPGKTNSLSGMALTAVYKDQNNHLWLGSRDGGLDRIDLTDNTVVNIKLPADLRKLYGDKNVFAIAPLNNEELLVNIDTVILRYNIAHNRFSFFNKVDLHVYKIFKDSNENLWISEKNIISIINPKQPGQPAKTIYSQDFSRKTSTRDILEDKNGQIWLANSIGLVKLNIENPKTSREFVPPGSETDPEVFCITEAKNGILWLGTIRNGAYAFDPETEKFTAHYSTNEGLIDNSVNIIFEDKWGKLWMSTWRGLAVLNPETGKIENFSTFNGLPFPEFNTNAHFLDNDGTMYFGGQGGVVVFHPDSLVNFKPATPLFINSVSGEKGLMDFEYPFKGDEKIEIPYNQNLIELSFSTLDFRHPEQRIYRYRLMGFQDNWTQIRSGELTARYTDFKPGSYTFEVQSSYAGWPFPKEEMKIFIRVHALPFYKRQSFVFTILATFLLSLILLAILRMRNLAMKREIEITRLEKEATLSNLNFLKSQMNPHFYFNTLNAINCFVVEHDTISANKFLTTFARLMREILENSQKEYITIADEREVLLKYLSLQQLRFPDLFEFTVEIANNVGSKMIPPMLLQPFVENSVEYAFSGMIEKGRIKVSFGRENNRIICLLNDNGIGIKKSEKIKERTNRKSTAIKNIYQRIEMLNRIYDLSIILEIEPSFPENEKFPGTSVRISFDDKEEWLMQGRSLPKIGILTLWDRIKQKFSYK